MPVARLAEFVGVPYGRLGEGRVVDAIIAADGASIEPWQGPKRIERKGYKRIIATDCAHYGASKECVSMVRGLPGCDDLIIVAGDGPAKAVKLSCDGKHVEASIQFPCSPAPDIANADTPSEEELAKEATSAVYTYVNEFGWESGPTAPSKAIPVSHGNKLTVSGIDWTNVPPGIERVNVYLFHAGQKEAAPTKKAIIGGYLRVATVKRGTTSVSVKFGRFGEGLQTIGDEPIPLGIRRMAANRRGVYAGLVGKSMVAISTGNIPWSWPSSRRLIFDGIGKAVAVGDGVLYVLTDGRPFIVDVSKRDCEGTDCFPAQQLPMQYPCVAPDSVAIYGDTVYYATTNGIVSLSGPQAKMLVQDEQSHWMALDPHTLKATIANGYYIAFGESASFAVRLDGRGLTELSDRGVRAVASTDSGRVVASRSGETFEPFGGDEFRELVYRVTPKNDNSHKVFAAWKVDAKIGAVTVRHYADDLLIDEDTVSDEGPRRLPRIRARKLEAELMTNGRVAGYAIATAITEL